MIDTSVIERKIHDQVMDMTFKAIVTEAFVGSLPIAESELTDGLTQGFVAYANECLEDLGSYKMLDKAIESAKDPVAKAYLKKMKMILAILLMKGMKMVFILQMEKNRILSLVQKIFLNT